MHVGFLTTEYPPLPSGGIGTSLRVLARALVRDGHRATVVGWGADAAFEDAGVRVTFRHVRAARGLGRLAMWRYFSDALRTLVNSDALDIVEAPDWCGLSAGLSVRCPVVVRCHGSATYFAHLDGRRVSMVPFGFEWLALRQADAVSAVSRFTAAETRRLFSLRAPVDTLPNGVELERFPPAPSSAMQAGLLLYVGTLQRKKGVLDVCRVFNRVADRLPEARLRLVGRDCPDGRTGSSSTWALCTALLTPDARRRTEYVGPQPHDIVSGHFAAAALCLMPSHAEALPLAWLEAMASARCLAAYDIGWAPEIIDSGTDGVLVAPGNIDALAATCTSLLSDPAQCVAIGRAARRKVESTFTAGVVSQQSIAWYERVLRARNAAPDALHDQEPALHG